MLHHDFAEEDEQAVVALLQAVAFVTTALRARPRRDALMALADPGLAAIAAPVILAFGFRLYRVNCGAEAVASTMGRRFDLIVLGAEEAACARRIRALPEGLSDAPILALGGGGAQREALSEAGVDGFVAEPVTPARIVDVLALLLGARAEA